MDENTEEMLRALTAQTEAHAFLLNYLLIQWFRDLGPNRDAAVKKMLEIAGRTEQFEGTARDHFHAERIADIVILMQQTIRELVDRALLGARNIEETGSEWPPR